MTTPAACATIHTMNKLLLILCLFILLLCASASPLLAVAAGIVLIPAALLTFLDWWIISPLADLCLSKRSRRQ